MKLIKILVVLLTLCIPTTTILSKKRQQLVRTKVMPKQEHIEELENTFGIKAELYPDEGVAKINIPRTDIKSYARGVYIAPLMGSATWLGFQKGEKKSVEVMVMGDILLTENEIDAALGAALDNNIQVTALHNHFSYDRPKLYFMHINAEGAVCDIAMGIKSILQTLKKTSNQSKKIRPQGNTITSDLVEQIIGIKGQAKDGMLKLVIGRQVRAGCGCTVGKNMGINTWVTFSGTDNNALVDGDFIVFEDELQSVLRSLRESNISIVAIHNHMVHENPRCLFVHYWGYGTVEHLAQSIKKALQYTK